MTVTAKNRGLSPSQMARVDACAIIFAADRPAKIAQIAADKGVDTHAAARIYVLGTLKAALRHGTARTYREALEALEAEQVGDRGCALTRTISADATAATVSRLMAATGTDYTVSHAAWAANIDGNAVLGPILAPYTPVEGAKKPHTKPHVRAIGKVLGTLYADWEAREAATEPRCAGAGVSDMTMEAINRNLHRYFAEYKSRLSPLVQGRVSRLMAYIDDQAMWHLDRAKLVIRRLVSPWSRTFHDTARLYNFCYDLHKVFEHKDTVTVMEFVELLYKYW